MASGRIAVADAAVRADQIDQRQIRNQAAVRDAPRLENRHRRSGAATARVNSCSSRDFPMPGSPTTLTTWPLPRAPASRAARAARARAAGRRRARAFASAESRRRAAPSAEAGHAKGASCPPTCTSRRRHFDVPLDRPPRRVADQDRAGLRDLLRAGRPAARRLADAGVLDARSPVTRLITSDPVVMPILQRDRGSSAPARPRSAANAALDRQRRQNRPAGLVFVDVGAPKTRDEAIRVRWRDHAVVPADFLLRERQRVARPSRCIADGAEPLDDRRRVGDAAMKHRRVLALALDRSGRRGRRRGRGRRRLRERAAGGLDASLREPPRPAGSRAAAPFRYTARRSADSPSAFRSV